MKKATLILISILLALFAFTACNNSIDYIIDDQPTDPMYMPLTLEFTKDGEFWIDYSPTYETNFIGNVEYSKNGGEREVAADGVHIQVFTGDKICLYRDFGVRSSAPPMNINCSAESECYVYGNVMSLIDSDDFATADEVHATLLGLFSGNEHISNHPTIDIILPATTLAEGCYSAMFYGCTGLTRAPELPATTLAEGCYSYMFYGCTSLTTAPVLPAETLTNHCYLFMFASCTSLTTAPELPAETLAYRCYYGMFQGCTSLTTAPELPATQLAEGCYYSMFSGCTSLTTAPVLPATSLSKSCYAFMFKGCTGLTSAPELPATQLAEGCYADMFFGCTSLETAPELPATTLAKDCYDSMFYGCTSLNSITCLATDISAPLCILDWMNNAGSAVASTKTFYRNPDATSIWTVGGNIPSTWTLEVAP